MKRFGLAPPLESVNAATSPVVQLLTALEEWSTAAKASDPVAYLEAGDGDLYITCPLSAAGAAELTRLIRRHAGARRGRGVHLFRRARSAGQEDPARPQDAGIPGTPGGAAGGLVLIQGGDTPRPGPAVPPPLIPASRAGLARGTGAITAARLHDLATRLARPPRDAGSRGRAPTPDSPEPSRPARPQDRERKPPWG